MVKVRGQNSNGKTVKQTVKNGRKISGDDAARPAWVMVPGVSSSRLRPDSDQSRIWCRARPWLGCDSLNERTHLGHMNVGKYQNGTSYTRVSARHKWTRLVLFGTPWLKAAGEDRRVEERFVPLWMLAISRCKTRKFRRRALFFMFLHVSNNTVIPGAGWAPRARTNSKKNHITRK